MPATAPACIALDRPELDLIDLLRLNDAPNFTLTVTCRNGWWQVVTVDLDQDHPDLTCEGRGTTFAEAWDRQKPAWAVNGTAVEEKTNA